MTTESPQNRDEIEEAAATWIARRDGEAWTASDAASLDAWLACSAGHRVAYYRLSAVWVKAARLQPASRASGRRLLAIAAGMLLLLAGVVVSLQTQLLRVSPHATVAVTPSVSPATQAASVATQVPSELPPPAPSAASFEQTYVTTIGASQTISLPDGSRVTLDTDSRIRVALDERSRSVHLDRGQGYFEVAHDRQRPFSVSAGRFNVIAVGTAFGVRRNAAGMRVVVAEGTVQLQGEALLPAGGIASLEGDSVQIHQATPAEVQRNLSWRSGVLTFRHTALVDAAAEFSRYGTRPVVIKDPAIGALELGGVFRANDVEAFVHLLERTFAVEATIHPDRIELDARKIP